MEDYITDNEFQTLLEDILYKLENNEADAVASMLQRIIEDVEKEERYIDYTYIGEIKEKKKKTRIQEIMNTLENMSHNQIENVYRYAMDEFDEPNHEAEALEAIISLSRRYKNGEND